MHAPDTIRITYQKHRDTGLLCAFSDDLKGLMVFGRTEEQLREKILSVCDALVHEQFGQDCKYQWTTEHEDEDALAPGFVHPDTLGTLIPEEACA